MASGVMAMAAKNEKAKNEQGATKKTPLKKAATAQRSGLKKPGTPQAVPMSKKPASAKSKPETSSETTPTHVKTMESVPAAQKISKQERERLKQILVAIKERLSGQVSSLKVDALTRDDGVNSSEDGTDAFDRQFALGIASAENHNLVEIDEAMRRLEDGTYGACEECGCMIAMTRLKALPFVRKCVGCQSKTENGRARVSAAALLDRP